MAARCSRVGTRWTTELADVRAPLYIHIYTSHFDTDALLHPLVVRGAGCWLLLPVVAVSAAAAATVMVVGSLVTPEAALSSCSPTELSDDGHRSLQMEISPIYSYMLYLSLQKEVTSLLVVFFDKNSQII